MSFEPLPAETSSPEVVHLSCPKPCWKVNLVQSGFPCASGTESCVPSYLTCQAVSLGGGHIALTRSTKLNVCAVSGGVNVAAWNVHWTSDVVSVPIVPCMAVGRSWYQKYGCPGLVKFRVPDWLVTFTTHPVHGFGKTT